MAWTNYHDWLMTEAIALMSEPGWNEQNEDGTYKYPDLMTRLESIRGELSTAAQGMGELPKLDPTTGQIQRDQSGNVVYESWDDKMGNLLSQFEQSRLQGEQFTNAQINALLGGTGGQWNPYDPRTGLGVMSYPQIAQAVQQGYVQPGSDVMAGMYHNAMTAYSPQQAQQQWQSAWGDVNQAGSLANLYDQARQRVLGYASDYGAQSQALVGTPGMTYSDIPQAAMDQFYGGARTAFDDLYSGGMTPDQILGQYRDVSGEMRGGYDQTLQNVMGYVDQMGDQQRRDVTAAYDKARAAADQGLADRGLGNTTVRNSLMTGIAGQESQEMARLNEQLAGLKAGYEAQLGTLGNQAQAGMMQQGMGAYQDIYGLGTQLGSQYANYLNQLGNQMSSLWQVPLGQAGASSQQLAQMQAAYDAQLGSQFNQAALGLMTGGLGAYGDFYNAMNQLGGQYAGYLQSAGQQMAGLWGQAPAAVAGITSASPSLADIYNLASQAGTGSTGIFALPGFQPGMIFGTGAAGSGG